MHQKYLPLIALCMCVATLVPSPQSFAQSDATLWLANGRQSPQVNIDGPFASQLPIVVMDNDSNMHIFVYDVESNNSRHFVRSKPGAWSSTIVQAVARAQVDAGNRSARVC